MKHAQNRLDFFICRPIIGIPLFFLVMYGIFSISFSKFGAWLTEISETFFFYLTESAEKFLLGTSANEEIIHLFIGIFKDTASILSYLPQTAIFFFLLKCLEDCGYMDRAVFAMDTFFSRFGLSGNAVLPAIIGCGCSVSAVSASRNLQSEERKILVQSVPFLICNARFPVLFILTSTFFPKHPSLAALFFYAFSILLFFLSSLISSKGKKVPPLIVRLKDYQAPRIHVLFQETKNKTKEYLNRTATVVFLCAVWIRLSTALTPRLIFKEEETESILWIFGKILSFLFLPLGFAEPPFSAALFAGFFAKENIISVLEIFSQKEIFTLLKFPARVAFTSFSMMYLPCFSMVRSVFKEWSIQKTILFLIRSFLSAYMASLILYTLSDILVAFVKI